VDVGERVDAREDQVGQLAGLHRADVLVEAHGPRADHRPGVDRPQRAHADVDQVPELGEVATLRDDARDAHVLELDGHAKHGIEPRRSSPGLTSSSTMMAAPGRRRVLPSLTVLLD
jgi:hypothetical protein